MTNDHGLWLLFADPDSIDEQDLEIRRNRNYKEFGFYYEEDAKDALNPDEGDK